MHGFTYDVNTSKQSELFTLTTKKVANFAGRTCKEAKDISVAIEELQDPTFTLPVRQNTGDSDVDKLLLTQEMQIYFKRVSLYRQNRETIYSVILGQCTDTMKAKLESEATFKNISQDRDMVELLKLMRDVAFNYESDKYPFWQCISH